MGKKESSGRSFIRLPILMIILALAAGAWWLKDDASEWKDHLYSYIENKEILTLESKYTPEQVMENNKIALLGANNKRTYQEPTIKYYPFLLLDVKYTEDKKSREGALLWSLTDGEIVLNTENWTTTHGLKDCLECEANRTDFKILLALARHNGILSLDDLQKDLHIEREMLDSWLDDAKMKHLVIQSGNLVKLHFENPKILIHPNTELKQHLVSKAINGGQKVSKVFSRSQIINLAKVAFGNDFKIRSEKEVFLPVYSIHVLNADGSLHTSDWNVITGQQIQPQYLSTSR